MFDSGPSFGGGFDFMFTLVPILIAVGFVLVIVTMIAGGVSYMKNARSPRETVYGRVVNKRMEVRHRSGHHHHHDGAVHHTPGSSRTFYYITLEFDNGERKEYLDVKSLSGLVVEGDEGYASVQGDWIVAFERK